MNPDSDLHSVSISSTLFNHIFNPEGASGDNAEGEEGTGGEERQHQENTSEV